MSARRFDIVVIGSTRSAEAVVVEARRQGATVAWIPCFPEARQDEALWRDLVGRAHGLGLSRFDRTLSRSLRSEIGHAIWRGASSARWSALDGVDARTARHDDGFRVLQGPPRFVSPTSLTLESGERIDSDAFVLATGVSPRRPSRLFAESGVVRDYRSMLRSSVPPRSVAIIGADWLGSEWASVFSAAGTEVTLIDRRSRLLRAMDGEFRTLLQGRMLGMGIDIVLDEAVVEIARGPHGECWVRLSSGREERVEECLVLAGQVGNSVGLGLEEVDVQMDEHGHVSTDEAFRSSVPSILAVGRVADPLGISPSSTFQARVLVGSILHDDAPPMIATTPWILQAAVEIASCGLTAEACGALDVDVIVGKASSHMHDRVASRVAKVVVDRGSGLLIGAQIAGIGATEAIGQACDALAREKTVAECAGCSHVESTAGETYHQALDAALRQWSATGLRQRVSVG